MSMTYTKDQKKVIKTRNKNILVSAAAGSGKTAVLTERIMDKICDPDHPLSLDRILIVTFTKDAAAEMKTRIGAAIDERLKGAPADSPLHMQKALLPISFITTIDSFCLYLIQNHFEEIGLDPSFRVADEGEKKLMKKDSLKTLLERECERGDEGFFACAECFDEDGSFKNLGDVIANIHNFACSMPFPEEWYEEQMKELSAGMGDMEKSPFMEYLNAYEKNAISELIEGIGSMIEICEIPGGPIQYEAALEDDLQFCRDLHEADFDRRTVLLSAHSFASLPGSRKKEYGPADKELQTEVKNFRDKVVKKILNDLKDDFHTVPLEERRGSLEGADEILYELVRLTREYHRILQETKQEAKVVDFSDMEHFALEILLQKNKENEYEKTSVAKSYEEFFEEIMVDEYQDSNYVQEMILDSISKQGKRRGNRFMVGDIKQSIYRFRLARPEIFLKKYNSFPKVKKGKDYRIDLSRNFRSRRSIINSVNTTFKQLMREHVGGILYDKDAELMPGFPYEKPRNKDYKTEILCLNKDEIKELGQDDVAAEAFLVAGKIRELYGKLTIYDKEEKQYRKASYRDMVILLKVAKDVDNVYKEVLESEGIPVFVISQNGYFQTQEVKVILNFLSILDNPRQDIPLAGTMTSCLGGFCEEDLARIRAGALRDELLYDSLLRYVEEKEGEGLSAQIRAFLEEIRSYRERAEFLSVSELLREVMEQKDYMNYISALPGGEKRRGNMDLLIQKAEGYETTGYSGIADFVRYIEEIKEAEVDFGESNLVEGTADVVRIMSIHKSKGLEYPVCFLSGKGKQFNVKEFTGDVLLDYDLGIGGYHFDRIKRKKTGTLKRSVIKLKKQIDSRGEDLRVLYVAMTRAREKLIITGSKAKPKNIVARDRAFYMAELTGAQSYMDLLLPIALAHPKDFKVSYPSMKKLGSMKEKEIMEKEGLWRRLAAAKPRELFREYAYPHESLEGLFVKTTVSELKKAKIEENTGEKPHFETDEFAPLIPQFLKKKEAGGSARGSAYHRVMELMDFSLAGKGEEEILYRLNKVREERIKGQMITEEEYDLVDERKVKDFLGTGLAGRMAEASEKGSLYLEQPFVLSLSAKELSADYPEEEKVLIQGVIDVYFEEGDGLVLMDYKTDRVSTEQELIDRYRTQLEYYKKALERLEGKKVKECLIYSFYFEKELVVE